MNSKPESLSGDSAAECSPEDRIIEADAKATRRLVVILWLIVAVATFTFLIWLVACLKSVGG